MVVTRYKPLFSYAASYELPDASVTTDGIAISAPGLTLDALNDFKLKPQFKENIVTVFFEGTETPADAPVNSVPSVVVDTDQYFYFNIDLSDKEKIKDLKFHSNDAAAKEIGFPVLYEASIPAAAAPPKISKLKDVKVITPLFTFIVTQAQSGLTSACATLEITDEKNAVVDLNIPPAILNDKSIDGVSAVPEYAFSVDGSNLMPGIYNFKVGNYKKKFFIASKINILNSVLLTRVLKNSFLEYKISLADNSVAAFELLIPKA